MAAAASRFPGATTLSARAGSITAMTSSKPAGWRTALLTVHIIAGVGAIYAALAAEVLPTPMIPHH